MIASFIQRHYRVVGISEILWDRLPAGKQLGGAPTNFVYHAKTLGAAGLGFHPLVDCFTRVGGARLCCPLSEALTNWAKAGLLH